MIHTLAELLEAKGYKDKRSIPWNTVCKEEALAEEFIRETSDQVNWKLVSEHQELSEAFIREFSDRLYWEEVIYNQKLSEGFIEEFAHEDKWQLDVEKLSKRQRNAVEKEGKPFDERAYWAIVSMKKESAASKGLSPAFIEKHQDELSWSCLSLYQKLPMQLIDRHEEKVDWNAITRHQVLSERFIEKHRDKVEWGTITFHQNLSERFVNKHQAKMSFISAEQKRTEAFLFTHLDKMDAASIIEHQNLRTVKRYQPMDIYVISKNRRRKYIIQLHDAAGSTLQEFYKMEEEELFEYLAEHDLYETIEKDFPELTLAEDDRYSS
ncbi:hypothetical protein [Planococcus sp. YIM B11945]|uniref:hypothetical protein n=1 Tax=Planococcus sp. YIM B11945 TaxID=3435410 RepID=UPI003D7D3EE4